jgi:hypothetical protein
MAIQFGLLLEDDTLAQWQLSCLEQLLAMEDIRLVRLISVGSATGQMAGGRRETSDARIALPPSVSELPLVDLRTHLVQPERNSLDFVLSFCASPTPAVSESLLASTRWGVWRFQFGDWVRFRGEPAGYWEVYEGCPVSAASLVRVTSDAHSIVVLKEGFVRTAVLSAAANRRQLQRIVTRWPAEVCRELRAGLTDSLTATPRRSAAPVRRAPNVAQRLALRCRLLRRMANEGYQALFRHTQWNVGIVDQPISSFLRADQRKAVHWLPPPARHQFRADPFGVVRGGRLTVLLEDFSYITNLGTITAFDPASGTELPVTIGPQPPVHLSYPYLLEVEGRLLCVPESHAAREVALYEIQRFPDRWRRIARFPLDKVIVDATLFRHDDHWWIAGSEPGIKGASSELHLWYAPALEGPWGEHPGNPVKIDIRSARPAGTPFYHEGALYRPAQDCSESYGGRISLNRVIALNPTVYREETVGTIEPQSIGPYTKGIHTLSQVGEQTLIDGKRIVFVPEEFRRNARHFLGRAMGG